MPLVKSRSKRAVAKNIRRLVGEGMPAEQAVAIARDVQSRARMPAKPTGKPVQRSKPEAHGEPPQTQARTLTAAQAAQQAGSPKRIPQRDGMRKRLGARIASGGAI